MAAVAAALSCSDFLTSGSGTGELSWKISDQDYVATRGASEVPDTNEFILKVCNSSGKVLYEGKYGDSPDRMMLQEGSYSVSVRSSVFREPSFSAPLYGDDQVAVVRKGGKNCICLHCTMLNSGLRLRVGKEFSDSCPGGNILVQSAGGALSYSFEERRTGYFMPGKVSVSLHSAIEDKLLVTRTLSAREVLDLGLSSSAVDGDGLSVEVDTSKTWINEDFPGEELSPGSDPGHALSIIQATASAGLTGVWVKGYIVGGDLTSAGSSMNTGPVFTKDTHLAIASRSSVLDKASCLSVELKKGPVRDALNLVGNPELLGRCVYVKGDIVESYYGIPGVKNVTEYSF